MKGSERNDQERFLPLYSETVKPKSRGRHFVMKPRLVTVTIGFLIAINAFAEGMTDPVVQRIYFEPVVINNIEVKSPTFPIDEPKLRSELEKQFNTWIVRSVTKKKLAIEAKAIESFVAKQDDLVLKATFDVPLTHQANMSHWSNQFRRGKFMQYSLTLARPDGVVVAKVTGGLTWGDGFWSQSRAKGRPSDQAHDEVMKGYMRKAVDRGVDGLKKALKSAPTALVATALRSHLKSPIGEEGQP
jgi:hypothetical protein